MPIIDLLELWSEAYEMAQEKAAFYGNPYNHFNPYDSYLVDQTDPAGCLDELQERAQAAPDHEPIDKLETPF